MHTKNGKLIGFIISVFFLLLYSSFLFAQEENYYEQNGHSVLSVDAANSIRMTGGVKEHFTESSAGEILAVPADVDTLIIYPTDDAYISVWNRNENYGNESYLDVLGKGGRSRGRYICCSPAYEFVSYLRFELPQIPGEILSATLNLFCNSGGYLGGIFFLNPVESNLDWDEKTITWNNRPNPLDDPQTFLAYRGNVPIHAWSSFDVTRALDNEWNAYTFVIAMQKSNSTEWSSKEGAHPPFLEIFYIKDAQPFVENLEYNTISPEQMSFNWETNVLTNSEFSFGLSPNDLSQQVQSSIFTKFHSLELQNLIPDTLYYYKITVHDQLGRSFSTEIDSFHTEKYDSLAPRIQMLSPNSDFVTNIPILMVRGKILDSDVPGVDINGNFYRLDTDGFFGGQVDLKEGANPIIITATDFSGNMSRDTVIVSLDTTPPDLVSHSINFVSGTGASITWQANEMSSAFLTYGTQTGTEDTAKVDTNLETHFQLNLSGLTPKTSYSYYIILKDSLDNTSQWGPFVFRTNEANQLRAILNFNYFGESTKTIDSVLVNIHLDGQTVKTDTALSGHVEEPNIVFGNQCEIIWERETLPSDNRAVDMYDAALTALFAVGKNQLDSLQKLSADVDQNNEVMMYDAAQIARFSVGLDVPPSSHVGKWKFIPDSLVIIDPTEEEVNLSVVGILLGDVHKDWHAPVRLSKNENSYDRNWIKNNIDFQRDTLNILLPLNEIEGNHFSFLTELKYNPIELRFLGIISKEGTVHLFKNVNRGDLRIGGFSTLPINEDLIKLSFLSRSHRNFTQLKRLDIAIDDQQLICANDILIEQKEKIEANTFELFQNYPNPFNGNTQIRFRLPHNGLVNITIFNQKGEVVKNILKKEMSAGLHKIIWNGTNSAGQKASSGLYFVRLIYGKQHKIAKLLYIR